MLQHASFFLLLLLFFWYGKQLEMRAAGRVSVGLLQQSRENAVHAACSIFLKVILKIY